MRRVFIIEALKGIKVNCPSDAYIEVFTVGRYTVQAMLLADGYTFHIFKGDELKAIISDKEWYISRMDGECQNLLNRLLSIYEGAIRC